MQVATAILFNLVEINKSIVGMAKWMVNNLSILLHCRNMHVHIVFRLTKSVLKMQLKKNLSDLGEKITNIKLHNTSMIF